MNKEIELLIKKEIITKQILELSEDIAKTSVDFNMYLDKTINNFKGNTIKTIAFFELLRIIGENNISQMKTNAKDEDYLLIISEVQNIVRNSTNEVSSEDFKNDKY